MGCLVVVFSLNLLLSNPAKKLRSFFVLRNLIKKEMRLSFGRQVKFPESRKPDKSDFGLRFMVLLLFNRTSWFVGCLDVLPSGPV